MFDMIIPYVRTHISTIKNSGDYDICVTNMIVGPYWENYNKLLALFAD